MGIALIGLFGPPEARISATEGVVIGWMVERRGDASVGGGMEANREVSMMRAKGSSSESKLSSSLSWSS
jgi:hypothetical protein